MSIFIDRHTRLVVQGITGREGAFHTRQMLEYGTTVVAGVTPGKGGQKFESQVPIFNTVADAVRSTDANCSVIYVPPMAAAGAIFEAVDAGIPLIVCITEGIPVMHMSRVMPFVRSRGARLIGPNCPGLITPGDSKVGIIPGNICAPGRVGLVSRSGTLTYEVVNHLTRNGIGQSTCVGIGGDPDHRHRLHRLPPRVSGGSGHRRHRHDRRDRWYRRAERRRVREGEGDQAGGWIHCGADGSEGTPDGPRRGHHLRIVRYRRGEAGGVRGRPASASCGVRWTSWRCSSPGV